MKFSHNIDAREWPHWWIVIAPWELGPACIHMRYDMELGEANFYYFEVKVLP